ncbi:MAG TPA: tetratricopeptide repeat protein [Candidatus Obscuribacter sp.]|nr:tetratricopeptide repeat protein [Candidatus Obscuribacter sp.]HMX44649.1 tetratricopeptide repeat protein [Candidatus Obscuribacter sp.]HMY03071.1 tetratricopeptide repeat protein [Candidatus Obscuribacter sp.]HNB15198.1 tetratricopeptide repeat protein [Candidatus Obscuribacter sp.]HND04784.1 tetratricopeptide repeat protein [Candidatus Obscuribacter sp.]
MQNNLKASAMVLAMLFLICQSESAGAFEQERFQKGLDAYSAGELDVARMHLFTFIKHNKGYYPAHYHLANILVQLGEYAEARTQYQAVLSLKPDKTTAGHCQNALARLAYMPAYGEPPAKAKQLNPAVAQQSIFEDMASRAQALDANRSAQMQTERARILADADKQADQVLDDAQKRISNLSSTGNWRVYYTNEKHEPTGEAGVGVPDRVANSILEPAREEANRIREAAKQRVARMSGGGGSMADTVMGLSKQAQSESGPRLSLDSNLHVRNYSHTSNMVAGKSSPTR